MPETPELCGVWVGGPQGLAQCQAACSVRGSVSREQGQVWWSKAPGILLWLLCMCTDTLIPIHIHLHIHTRTHKCPYTYTCTFAPAHTHVHMHVPAHVYFPMHTQVPTWIHFHMSICTYTYSHAYTCTRRTTHKYTPAHMHLHISPHIHTPAHVYLHTRTHIHCTCVPAHSCTHKHVQTPSNTISFWNLACLHKYNLFVYFYNFITCFLINAKFTFLYSDPISAMHGHADQSTSNPLPICFLYSLENFHFIFSMLPTDFQNKLLFLPYFHNVGFGD